ncbi:MAG TPA: hypothetical protein DEE98_02725 [Elusimicrobia bacterium]|nr:MAG: hypothetical protein A2278_07555 [Elusimicrobia bacterium RIFOXYA12_FULL_49_49]OGS16078.1 MAG: hypothetical protein A2251_02710 [Elusimicrobia bacterium RIFOXYA2_FULL_47_53]OGS26704.1 MAG: hypothetical protein A2339_03760 [Elusimicrobia bacterium RIFOXYB12_FULL_50_12]OGS30170.1 MAG: hypothetical protein A2323_01825 [Elusimicrobia bacterium RIFOXYB2_FULL_46_23]HBU69279.1 hypothetical protein [Elusimicrobiota bacterium]
MNRQNLISLILLDAILLFIALGMFGYRYYSVTKASAPAAAVPQPSKTAAIPSPQARAQEADRIKPQTEKPAANGFKITRNIGFTYRSSKARKVEVIGDFNDWIPRKMTKGKDYKWAVTLALEPGEYAYNFVVDGRPIRDPNNSKVCDAGRGFPNSYLKVSPHEQRIP